MHVEALSVGEFQVNCYLVWGDLREALVIDPGHEAERIAALLSRHGLRVAAYLLTHGHVDHISALADLHTRYPAPIGLHPLDAVWAFSNVNALPPFYGVARQPCEIGRAYANGQVWNDGGLAYEILSTPGHTPGSVCFHFAAQGLLFSGDTLFAGSVGRTDFAGGDPVAMRASLAHLAKLPPATVIHAGHGPSTDLATEKRYNCFLRGL